MDRCGGLIKDGSQVTISLKNETKKNPNVIPVWVYLTEFQETKK